MKIKRILRHPVTWVVGAVAIGVFAFALYLFQPWRLFTTVEVDEALPTVRATPTTAAASPVASPPAAAGPREIASGTFISHEHETSGRARVLELPDGSRVLRIENLATSDGPDLRVWLSDQPVKPGEWRVFDDGKWLELGDLKGNKGNANYAIPASADLDDLTSVTIWCRRFSVSFGAAALKP
jgi:hypothetical protein